MKWLFAHVYMYATYRNLNRQCSNSRERTEMKTAFSACLSCLERSAGGRTMSQAPRPSGMRPCGIYYPYK